ncbi:unnamed protein product [Sympodiomycopsis kandeliae]
MAPEEALAQGSKNLVEAFNASPAFTSSSLTYDPATLKYNHGQLDASNSYNGHSSEKLAAKLAEYAKQHQNDGGLQALWNQQQAAKSKDAANDAANKMSSVLATSQNSAVTGATAAGAFLATVSNDPAFSFSELLSNRYGFRVVYCIVWIVMGVSLMLFGLPSFYWATSPRLRPKAGKTSRRIIGGGIGGVLIGFLSGSFLTSIITNAVSTRQTSSLSPGGMFAVWLAPGLLTSTLGAHFRVLSRVLTGLLAGVCLTLILTATFGIHTIMVRSILLAIACVGFTTPLLIPPKTRYPRTKKYLLVLNTSLIGAVTFLDGVALFAPPVESSRAWIDLWTLLFAPDDSPSQHLTVRSWGSSAFKGYIAGAILATAVSIAIQAWFHRHAGESVEDEWNEYLGVYTGKMEKGGFDAGDGFSSPVPSANDGMPGQLSSRAGMFEEPKSLWRKIVDRLDDRKPSSRPAQYGNIAGGATAPSAGGFSFTQRKVSNRSRTSRPHRSDSRNTISSTASGAPARFQAVSKKQRGSKLDDLAERGEYDDDDENEENAHPDSDSDSDATDVEFGHHGSTKKTSHFSSRTGNTKGKSDPTQEALDTVPDLPKLINYGGYALPASPNSATSLNSLSRPPSFRTDSGSSNAASQSSSTIASASLSGSQLSGSTAVTATSNSGEAEKPFTSYRDADVKSSSTAPRSFSASSTPSTNRGAAPRLSAPPPTTTSSNNLSTPATPSLINAIQRIQLAQTQARQWATQGQNPEPYGPQKASGEPNKS